MYRTISAWIVLLIFGVSQSVGQSNSTDELSQHPTKPNLIVSGSEPGWQVMTLADFENVNCQDDTWSEKDGTIHCNGNCVGVIRSKKQFTNCELLLQWQHLSNAGNSGVFLWTPQSSLDQLKPKTDGLPHGIEVQILDLGYKTQYEQGGKRKADWFTCHGDVFPVGNSSMKPFPPTAPNGKRSFPTSNHTKGVGEWNQYYIRAINGEVRLWVNGHEVSGGNECKPATGYIALEAEGAPIEFKNIRIRELR